MHSGALGWVAMISIRAMYHLIPAVCNKDGMYSLKLINTHFWLHTIGVVLHIVNSMVIPLNLGKSYSIYAGAVDAMVQWWSSQCSVTVHSRI